MRESQLLSAIYEHSADLSGAFEQVQTGPGDDCAVLRTPHGDQLLVSVDQVIEGVHYSAGRQPPLELIGRKAIARALSDIAAMGGRALGAVTAAALAPEFARAEELFEHARKAAAWFGCPLVGGDIAIRPGPLALTTTVLGVPGAARGPVLRSEACVGDVVYVTGELGGSFDPETGQGRHLTFDPRLSEGAWLAETLGDALGAMIDLSDGLGIDGGRVAAASEVALEIEAETIPHSGVGWRRALADGEDYELLFTVRPGVDVPRPTPGGTMLTRIGRVIEGRGCFVIAPDGERIDAAQLGWNHGQQ
ncbi:MAG: thiamine-phosphate kinase [Phycisphaerales bacterium JB039]